jgi:hypothetical protein
MARLRNVQSGAVVSCSEETAARLGSEWEPADTEPEQVAKRTVAKKAAASKSK